MGNGINGGLCLLKRGAYSGADVIFGQGDATVNHGGEPIEINNKSSGGWRENLVNAISTKSLDIDVEITVSDNTIIQELIADAFAGIAKVYTMDFIDYYYEGVFTPVISSEAASKDAAVTLAVQFKSSGAIERKAV